MGHRICGIPLGDCRSAFGMRWRRQLFGFWMADFAIASFSLPSPPAGRIFADGPQGATAGGGPAGAAAGGPAGGASASAGAIPGACWASTVAPASTSMKAAQKNG